MSLTSWVESTIANIAPLGEIATRHNGTAHVVTWNYGSKTVLLGESKLMGRKRALYEVLNNGRVIAQIRRLEADAQIKARIAAMAAEYEGTEFCEADEFVPTDEDRRMANLAAQG